MTKRDKLRLGIFGINSSSGITMTTVDERWAAEWKLIKKTVQIADKGGIDFILPLMRWSGYGGETNPRGCCFESISLGSALAALTERIKIYTTVHTSLVNPTYCARALATVEQISNGRLGVNLVSGWQAKEFEMFGVDRPGERYYQASEWLSIVKLLLSGDTVDYEGTYHTVKEACSNPSCGRMPNFISAAFSEKGREFAMANCDALFTTFSNLGKAEKEVFSLKKKMEMANKSLKLYTPVHVVCRDTDNEAQEYYDYCFKEKEDTKAVDNFISEAVKDKGPRIKGFLELNRPRLVGGFGSYEVVGCPQTVAIKLKELYDVGFTGIAMGFVNYLEEVRYFTENVLPIIREYNLDEA